MTMMISGILLILVAGATAQRFDCDPCVIREKVKISTVIHGTKSSSFWQQVEASMRQAAADMRVDMDVQLYDSFDTSAMTADILSAASADPSPDGLIVTM